MKRFKLLLFFATAALLANGQAGQINQVNIVSFNVKNTLPSTVDAWMSVPGALILVAQKVPNSVPLKEPRLVVQIKSGGAVICGNNLPTAKQIDPFDVRTFNTADLTGLLANCKELKEGTYTICAQFYNIDRVAISREVCKDFRVEAPNVEYAPPTLITPENGKKFTVAELQRPVMFRWTPLVPKPKEPVTYKIRVWQLMQGQTATTAKRTNTPIYTADVQDQTQAIATAILTGPCRPPYLCDFIWEVQALNRNGKPMGNNNGTSEPFTFSATDENSSCPANTLPENDRHFSIAAASQPILFKWTNAATPGTTAKYRLKVWQLMQGQSAADAMKTNPVQTKEVTNATETTLSGLYTGPCRPPYLCDFIWAVEMLDASGRVSCTSKSSRWVLDPADPAGNISSPVNTYPENNKKLPLAEVMKEVKFRWTPIVPKPQEPVTYKLKVWQLMQGQTPVAAMKNNKPVAERAVTDNTETSISNLLTGPCRPPYLCDFVWNVQALNREGKPIGPNNGNSEPTTFFATTYIIQLDSIKVLCTNKPGTYSFSFTLTNVNPGTANLTNFAITSSTPAGAIFGTYAPPIGTGISTGNQLTVTGTLNAATNLSYICIGAEITDAANSFWKASKDTCIKVEPCRCDACDEKNFVMNAPKPAQINWANNMLTFNQPLTITTSPPKTIKTIKAELVYFELIPQLSDCLPCDKDSKLYGHFANGTNSEVWTGAQSGLNISITTPNAPCCSTLFRWCIRYKIEFADCTVCSKTVCYEKKKEGCVVTHGDETGTTNPNQPK